MERDLENTIHFLPVCHGLSTTDPLFLQVRWLLWAILYEEIWMKPGYTVLSVSHSTHVHYRVLPYPRQGADCRRGASPVYRDTDFSLESGVLHTSGKALEEVLTYYFKTPIKVIL